LLNFNQIYKNALKSTAEMHKKIKRKAKKIGKKDECKTKKANANKQTNPINNNHKKEKAKTKKSGMRCIIYVLCNLRLFE